MVKISRSSRASASSSGGTAGSPYGGSTITPSGTASASESFSARTRSPDLRVDELEVHVGDPLGRLLDDLQVVAVAVGDVAGVQAQVDELRVGVVQELQDPVLGVHVGVGVRVEDQLDAVLLVDHLAEFVGAGDQVRPLLRVQVTGLGGRAGVHVGVLLGQVDQVLGADLG